MIHTPDLLKAAKDLLRWATTVLNSVDELKQDSMGGNFYADAMETDIAKAEGK